MPKTSRYNQPRAGELPGTKYGESDQASRAAYAEFKRTFEKRGDHWIPRQDRPR